MSCSLFLIFVYMLLVYTPHISPRTRYIFSLLFEGILRSPIEWTTDQEEFRARRGPKINYSREDIGGGLFFAAHGLLGEKVIKNLEVPIKKADGRVVLFPHNTRGSSLDFDPFAAAFYLVTRYEEYQPFVRDEYGRFQAKDSLAVKHDFLHRPVVNEWAELIAEKISKRWRSWKSGPRKYRFIPTIDINASWMYKRKGFFRTSAALLDAMGKGRFREALDRIKVVSGRMRDPFDTYYEQLELQKEYGLETMYFILFADYDTNDRNVPVNNRHFRVLIKSLADYCNIGIHTSYASLRSQEKLETEFQRLSAVLNKEITATRQHFHVLNMPLTYRNFVNQDVSDDYSMGYAVTPGFRAGICDPYPFYDLDIEMQTNLTIWPYALVDKGLLHGYGLESSFRPIIEKVKAVNGTLITLWNNESLVAEGPGKLNLRTYEKMLIMARP